ncbi:organic hydroperoxide resistance protein [Microbacterium caowuchunii]|uniref:Organic hydroperoxide resistance protein n=1 Tax=Microbacterium caowuchunii TaxID=2614638 RepID=A0A5J6KWC7_9MICO|nr:organic hydroperoxide resistance protein [Microbacterium caowuchunii]KAA9132347.1 organic hydroperoxide resistance protein [Microbacterium caowuchunii]QEW00902.1 organic hydroperoxide resistance protein [Microbacterium caowuchunii]
MEAIYTAEALSTGDGRNGHVVTSDGILDTDVRTPKEMGGPGGAPNPELLFAAGYAACFHSALQAVARMQKVALQDSSVGARVELGPKDGGGFQLAVELEVVLPGIPADQAQALADAAHQMCPYSNATRGNIDVAVRVTED